MGVFRGSGCTACNIPAYADASREYSRPGSEVHNIVYIVNG
jgi:hypothetical protein